MVRTPPYSPPPLRLSKQADCAEAAEPSLSHVDKKPFEKAEPRGWVPWLNERRQRIPASAFHPVEGARRDSPTPKPDTWEAVQTQNFQKKGLIS